MTKEMIVRIKFNSNEAIRFDIQFRAELLGYCDPNKLIVDYAITPVNSEKCFSDEEMNTLLSEFDEKLTSYEIIGIKEI